MPRHARRESSGATSALVDHGPLGGLCILRGCMPSKALIASSDAPSDARDARALGSQRPGHRASTCRFVARRKRGLVKEFADYRIDGHRDVSALRRRGAVPLAHGAGRRRRRRARSAERSSSRPAASSRPRRYAGLAETGYIDSDAALELERIPESAIVFGGGYTACELGQFFARMGAPDDDSDSQRPSADRRVTTTSATR